VANGTGINTQTPGANAFTVNSSDDAGNRNSATVSYTVGYGIRPLYAVVAKQSGSTYPIELQLSDANGNNVSSPNVAVHAAGVILVSSGAPAPLLSAGNANPDLDFRYDASLGGYIFNLKLTGYATGTYSLQFTAGNDSAVHNALFQVK
jgi:endoglucanase Acf2